MIQFFKYLASGSGCGSVGRADTSDTKGKRFESSQLQTLIKNIYFSVKCVEKTKIREKVRLGVAHSKKFLFSFKTF